MPSDRVHVNGGIAELSKEHESGCANGAAGTVYYVDEDILKIDNKGNTVTATTGVNIPDWKIRNTEKDMSELASKLFVTGSANLIIKGQHAGLTFDELNITSKSTVVFG